MSVSLVGGWIRIARQSCSGRLKVGKVCNISDSSWASSFPASQSGYTYDKSSTSSKLVALDVRLLLSSQRLRPRQEGFSWFTIVHAESIILSFSAASSSIL